ncbi:MAG: hypothetical protein K7J47_06690 [Acidobacteria bacterium]|jgi:hypothetical protein|nr:hypothetical protein [Bryobacteraceae bacterium CoA2 C42]
MRWLVWLLAAAPAAGHMVSLSSGQMEISGTTAQLVLRVPAYEAPEGEKTLGDAYRIAGATLRERTCRTENEELVCTYRFTNVPAAPRVICRLAEVLVANHVHVLTAQRDGAMARHVFSGPEREAELRFDGGVDPLRDAWDGLRQAYSGWARMLLLFTIGFAARRRREAAAFGLALMAGQGAALWLALPASPRFVEAAAAIGVGYLAFEVWLLPEAGHRWAAVAGVGLLLGLGVPAGGSGAFYGSLLAGSGLAAGAVGGLTLARRNSARPAAMALLVVAMAWFAAQFVPGAPLSN